MRAELRSDGLHISGYVNVPGRKSRPIMTAAGRAIEIIEQGVFKDALSRAKEVRMLQDHRPERVLADTADGTLKIKEDAVGLRAEAVVTDEIVIDAAKKGKIRGWSFDMDNVKDDLETRADDLPIRHVKSLDISEVSLIIDRIPCYSSTSVEIRGEEERTVETRANMEDISYVELEATPDEHINKDVENPSEERSEDWKEAVNKNKSILANLKGGAK